MIKTFEEFVNEFVDTNKLVHSETEHLPYRITHYPSSSVVKGSDIIESIARKLFKVYPNKFTFKSFLAIDSIISDPFTTELLG